MRVVNLQAVAVCLVLAMCSCQNADTSKRPAVPVPSSVSVQAPFDVSAVVTLARRSFRASGKHFEAGEATHTVRADADGLTFIPVRVHGTRTEGRPLYLAPARVTRGGIQLNQASDLTLDSGRLAAVSEAVTEFLVNDGEGVEQSWSFASRPAGKGDLEVTSAVSGMDYTGVTDTGHHFVDRTTGLGVRYGHATWVDASGERTPLRVRYEEGRLAVRVPSALLEASAYPAVLDPRISPEFGTDNPVPGSAASYQDAPDIASDGTNYLLVWSDWRALTKDIYAARVSASGQLLDPTGFPVSSAPRDQLRPTVTFDGTQYIVAWEDLRSSSTADIYAARVSAGGTVLDPQGLPVSTAAYEQRYPALTSDGTNTLVVWEDRRLTNQYSTFVRIYGARIGPSGTVLDPTGIEFPRMGAYPGGPPDVAFDGTNYLVVWTEEVNEDVYGAFLTPSGNFVGSPFLIGGGNTDKWSPVIAFGGGTYLVAWTDVRRGTSNTDVYATRVTPAGLVSNTNGVAVNSVDGNQDSVSVAFNGSNFLVTWRDARITTSTDIYAARVTPSGAVLDGGGLIVATASGDQREPAVAAVGSGFFLVWTHYDQSSSDIHGSRMDGAGSILAPADMPLSRAANSQSVPAVAFDGTNYLMVWADARGENGIYAVRVSATGTVLDPNGVVVAAGPGYHDRPAIAFNGTHYLIVWTVYESGITNTYGTRMSVDGSVLDPTGILIARAAVPAVASDGTDFFVVGSAGLGDIYGKMVSASGEVMSGGPGANGVPVSTATGSQGSASVAFDGTNYLVVWADQRNDRYNSDVYGARVTRAGTVLDTSGFAISAAVNSQSSPSLAFDGSNYLVVWQDTRNGVYELDVYAARVTLGGQVLEGSGDGAGFPIYSGALGQQAPSVTFDGTQFVVAWEDARHGPWGVYVTRVDANGSVQEPAGLKVSAGSPYESQPAIASGGTGHSLVAYRTFDASAGFGSARVRGRLLTPNLLPRATPQAVTLAEDQAAAITLAGDDPEGDPLTFSLVSAPSNGTLSGIAPHLTYTPYFDFHGADSFSFMVDDGLDFSEPATVTVTVSPTNDAPFAQAASVSVVEDGQGAIQLIATDVENDPTTFAIEVPPTHGTLDGSPPSLTYTPLPDFSGTDTFSFTANDGSATSAPAVVTLNVTPVNDPPKAIAQQLAVEEDIPAGLVLQGFDVDGDSLSFTIVSGPAMGTLSGTPPNLAYTPAAHQNGSDAFSFTVSDGTETSPSATVTLTITANNDAPTATAQMVTVVEDSASVIVLAGTDVEGDALTFLVLGAPAHGTLSGMAPNITYTPRPDFNGTDTFTFVATDGQATSAPATVSITVSPVDDAPIAVAQALATAEDTPLALVLTGMDVDGDSLTFAISTPPSHGSLSGTPPNLTYTPGANFNGADSIAFTVRAHALASVAAVVSISVTPLQDKPIAAPMSLSVVQGQSLRINLSGFDADGDGLSYAVQTDGIRGNLTGLPPSLAYSPPARFRGQEAFTFTVSDGTEVSAPATVVVQVVNAQPEGTLSAAPSSPREGELTAFSVEAVDPGGDPLTYFWRFGDGATSSLQYPTHVYAAAGTYAVTVEVSDGVATVTGQLEVTVTSVAPTISAIQGPTQGEEGAVLAFSADASDVNPSTRLSYSWAFGDGSAASSGPSVSHQWADDGIYTLTLTVSDAEGESSSRTQSVVIENAAPRATPMPNQRISAGVLRLQLRATDPAGANDPLSWTLIEGPGTLSLAGEYTWRATAEDAGVHTVRAIVADDGGALTEMQFEIEVVAAAGSGCGCTSGGGGGLPMGILALAFLFWRRATRGAATH